MKLERKYISMLLCRSFILEVFCFGDITLSTQFINRDQPFVTKYLKSKHKVEQQY